jgi:hypothetical protein
MCKLLYKYKKRKINEDSKKAKRNKEAEKETKIKR